MVIRHNVLLDFLYCIQLILLSYDVYIAFIAQNIN